jgi:hypothetical protein
LNKFKIDLKLEVKLIGFDSIELEGIAWFEIQ